MGILAAAIAVGVYLYATTEDTPAHRLVGGIVSTSDCAPTRANGRALTNGEWNLIIEFASDSRQQLSRDGVTLDGEFRTWCQLRDHPVYSTSYWFFVEDIEGTIGAALFFCSVDPHTYDVTC